MLGGAGRMRVLEFGGRRPYRFLDERHSASGRWEIWMDAGQARAVHAAAQDVRPGVARPMRAAISPRRSTSSGGPWTSYS